MEIMIEFAKIFLYLIPLLIGYGKLIQKVNGIETLINSKLGIANNKIQKDLTIMDKRLTKGISDLSERVVVVETKLDIDSEPGLLEE